MSNEFRERSADVWRAPQPPEEEYQKRLAGVQAQLVERGLDCLIAVSAYMEREGNVVYLSGHRNVFPPWASDHQRNGVGFAAAVIFPDGPLTVLASYRADETSLAPTVGEVLPGLDLAGGLLQALAPLGGSGRCGVAGTDVLPMGVHAAVAERLPKLEWVPANDILVALRSVKSTFEIAQLRRSARVADYGLQAAFEAARPGVTEKAIAAAIHAACFEAGADQVVRMRVRSGPELLSQGRWPLASERPVQDGEVVYLDLLGWVGQYAFDVARSWGVGTLSSKLETLVEESVEVLQLTTASLQLGRTGDEVVRAAAIAPHGRWCGEYFQMGHGIGIECVENPWILPGASMSLQAGMVLSLEPSLLLPGRAKAQQEDMVLLGEHGPERLTTAPYGPPA